MLLIAVTQQTNNATACSTLATLTMLPLAAPQQHQQCCRLHNTLTTLLTAVAQQTNNAAAYSTLTTLTISALQCSGGYGCPYVFTIPVWLVKQYLNTDVSVYRYVCSYNHNIMVCMFI